MNLRAIELDAEEDPWPKTALGRFQKSLGERLLAAGRITDEELREAMARAGRHGIRLSTALHELGLVDEAQLRSAASQALRTRPALPADVVEGARGLGTVFDAEELIDLGVIPFARKGGKLWIATAEPWRLALLDDLAERIGCRAELLFLDEGPLALCLESLFGHPADPRFKQPVRRRLRAPEPAAASPQAGEPELMSESTFDDLYQR